MPCTVMLNLFGLIGTISGEELKYHFLAFPITLHINAKFVQSNRYNYRGRAKIPFPSFFSTHLSVGNNCLRKHCAERNN